MKLKRNIIHELPNLVHLDSSPYLRTDDWDWRGGCQRDYLEGTEMKTFEDWACNYGEMTDTEKQAAESACESAYDASSDVQQEPIAWVSPIVADFFSVGNGIAEFSYVKTEKHSIPLHPFPPDAQAEIAKRDERIVELEQQLQQAFRSANDWAKKANESHCTPFYSEQAAEISRLKGVIAKCKVALSEVHDYYTAGQVRKLGRDAQVVEALAAIKGEGL